MPLKKINKVLLISPRYTLFINDVRRCIPPLGLTYLASYLEKNSYRVKIIDCAAEGYEQLENRGQFVTYGLKKTELEERIKRFKPDVVGVSCIFSTQSENANEILATVKKIDPKIITLFGGSHPTYTIEEALKNKNVDYVVIGEGELPTLELLNKLNLDKDISKIDGIAFRSKNKIIINNNRQFIQNLDDLPFPAYHLIDMEKYFRINLPQNPYPQGKRVAQIVTSRGCSAKCIFCTTTNFWGNRYRGRSAENVLKEIKQLKDKYQIDEIQFTDDNLTLNKERAIAILDGLKKMNLKWCLPQGVAVWALDEELLVKMKECGCYQLTFAIESGNQYVLSHLIKKPLRLEKVKPLVQKAHELGIKIHAFCICGIPGEKISQMHETFQFIKNCKIDSASFFVATPLIGSELHSICKKNNYLIKEFSEIKSFYKIGNITTPDFTADQVQKITAYFNHQYNRNDNRIKKFEKNKY